MIKRIISGAIAAAGGSLGYGLGVIVKNIFNNGEFNLPHMPPFTALVLSVVLAIIAAIIFYILAPWIIEKGKKVTEFVEAELEKLPPSQLLAGTAGLIIGFIIAFLLSGLIRNLVGTNIFFSIISAAVYAFFGYLGVSFATRKINDIVKLPDFVKKISSSDEKKKGQSKKKSGAKPKILDTSVIIDGRIADICKTGFIEGPLIVSEFVLEELRHIADSSDGLKRNRGRRGLDILKLIQKDIDVEVVIDASDFEDTSEVDIKLLKLTQKLDGMIVTNDYNLNKVADLQGVKVLNINELANAVKPVVLPGEEMSVLIAKEGKEATQGVAYLDDGTMIVVEGARKHIGKQMTVVVTSVLQTAAGRMIFAKQK